MWGFLFRSMAHRLVQTGELVIELPDGTTVTYGDGGYPKASIQITDPSVFRKLLLNPELAMGEAYMDGTLTIKDDDIVSFLRVIIMNVQVGNAPKLFRLLKTVGFWRRKLDQHSPLNTARQNVEHHYDIPTEFYRLFLDRDFQYTCGYFKTENDDLETSQINKQHHIATKLMLRPGMRVLDIGTGWGGLACTLAREYGVYVVGVTLSEEQRQAAIARAELEGVSHLTEFRLQDYRDVPDKFDRVVSVGMMEHVGEPQYQTYFDKIGDVLKDDGIALVHFIGRTTRPARLSPWFNKYIFPGGYAPALSEVMTRLEKSDLHQADVEVWRTHYEKTLQAWLAKFENALPTVRDMGFDERFIRMWRYYLQASEVSFSDLGCVVFQLQLAKDQSVVPVLRDYLYEGSQAGFIELEAAE